MGEVDWLEACAGWPPPALPQLYMEPVCEIVDRVALWQVLPPVEVFSDWWTLCLISECHEDAPHKGSFCEVGLCRDADHGELVGDDAPFPASTFLMEM